ncbi:HRC135 protein [Uncinocarpus reesii 1704]|uniref:HRC135 protein n=1 Tax=Uncinocarpus reesii (strain UAMH 1704) TaxID=336963 RepID=C4JR29_UNCRE|nr:HRC135 protein [Uncinocarpus reesii 1704]EEP78665.1 HRC135 protein [Uncinocarpus reesii 1704]
MADNLAPIVQLLQATLDPRQHKQAEAALRQAEKKPGYSLQLLHITANNALPYNTRLSSALYFKNFIKWNWTDEDGNYKLEEKDVKTIKQELISLMISMPPGIQTQLGEAVSVIADSDFWRRWDTLVGDLVSRLSPDNIIVNIGVLQVAHSIFKRWRPLFRSDELYEEINHVLERFGQPYLALFESLDSFIDQNRNDKEKITQAFSQLNLMIKLFYDLSCHDLPPMFEDHVGAIASLLLKYLTYDNPLLHTADESEAGQLEFVKAGIFEALVLYVQKYIDIFGDHVHQFISSSWNLLTTIGQDTKYDILDDAVLSQVTEKVILPNISLRESDIEMFEDEPIEFIRRDLEGGDSETRDARPTDFLRQCLENFEHSPSLRKGVATATHGVTTTNPLVSITDFFQKHLASDLVATTGVQPLLKVDAIKFLYSFRSLITKEQWREALPLLVQHLGSSVYVVYTYAAVALEKALCLADNQNQPVIPASEITPLAPQLLEHIFQLIEKDPSPPKVQENEFLMRCIMRVLLVIKDSVVPIIDPILQHLVNITKIISTNPSNPRFYYYHFEALGALIRFGAPSQPSKVENALYTPFVNILQSDVQEFMPYVFQLLSALLEAQPSNTLPENYQSLIAPILIPTMWETRGNIPALVRLLSSILPRGAGMITQNNQIEPILGIFQKLVSSKLNESYGFDLLENVISAFPSAILEKYFATITQIILTRLEKSKTENFTLRFVRFYHFISALNENGYGCDFFIQVTEHIQSGVFTPIYLNIILPESRKLARPLDRKVALISFTKTLANSDAFANRYKKGWGFTCEALLNLVSQPPLPAAKDDIIRENDVEDMTFGVGYTQLNTIKKAARDPWPQIGPNLGAWVATYLKEADTRHGGRISSFAQERLSPEAKAGLANYLSG